MSHTIHTNKKFYSVFINDRGELNEAIEYASWADFPRKDIVLVNFDADEYCPHCGHTSAVTTQEYIEPTPLGLTGSQKVWDILSPQQKTEVLRIAESVRRNAAEHQSLEVFLSFEKSNIDTSR